MAAQIPTIDDDGKMKTPDDSDDEGYFMADFFTKDLDLEDKFDYQYGSSLTINLNGIAREYGQTVLGTGDGTGLTIWRGAEELNNYLWAHQDIVRGTRCLELGAGLGLVGILLAQLDAVKVVITDGDLDTMQRILENFELNGFSKVEVGDDDSSVPSDATDKNIPTAPVLLQSILGKQCHVAKFLWENENDLRTIMNLSRQKQQQHSFGVSEDYNSYDLIVAADVVYEEGAVSPLILAVTCLLERKASSKFILSFARRNVPVEKVIDAGSKHGLACQKVEGFECAQSGENIYEFRWKLSVI